MTDVGSRLFLSCDLVGSTRHKQSAGDTRVWIPDFLRFYYDFPARVREALDDSDLASRLKFWKAVGDELLFTIDIKRESDVYRTVNAWVKAMAQYEAELGAKNREGNSSPNKMKTKGGAFIATFPDPDYVVAVPTAPVEPDSERDVVVRNEAMKKEANGGNGHLLIDYLGPSIDTGFRVISACNQRYFTLSLEVAWAMTYHRRNNENKSSLPGLLLLEERQMKGVWDEREYPVFAIDRHRESAIVKKINRVQGRKKIGLLDVDGLAAACLDDEKWPSRVHFRESAYDAFTRLKDTLTARQEHLDGLVDSSGESIDEFRTDGGDVESGTEDSAGAINMPPPRPVDGKTIIPKDGSAGGAVNPSVS
ncbi:hypothetical protein [Mycobacterium sp. SMC-19]|uniref:hypothetical protein n=1 Tax=Mycobacterium sp. SMC-19 TaxID=3381630 RepID=UPI0038764BA6